MFAGLRNLFRKTMGKPPSGEEDGEAAFARRRQAFRRFLSAWNGFQVTMTDLEYALCCDHPFGVHRVRALCTSVATQVYRCIRELESLDPRPGAKLSAHFDQLQKQVLAAAYQTCPLLTGPSVLPLSRCLEPEVGDLVDPATVRLERLRPVCPEAVPQGFVITAAGCRRFFLQPDLAQEIGRLVQAGGGYGPAHLEELSRSLTDLIGRTPLPAELRDAVLDEVRDLRRRCPGGMRLLFRGRLWPTAERGGDADDFGIRDPGLPLWGPPADLDGDDEDILKALHATLALKRGPLALIYRRARGLTDCDAGMCVTCMAVGPGERSGLAHTASPLKPRDGVVHAHSCAGLPRDLEKSALPVETDDFPRDDLAADAPNAANAVDSAGDPAGTAAIHRRAAALALRLAEHEGCPLSVSWTAERDGGIRILLVRPMILAQSVSLPAPADVLPSAEILLSGGSCANPGRAVGPLFVARTREDAQRMPRGAILVAPDDRPPWATLVGDAAGLVLMGGRPASRLGSLAREFGRPALFCVGEAAASLESGRMATLCADTGQIFAGRCDALMEGAPRPRDFMPGSPVFRMLQAAGERILPLTLEEDSPDFRAENCATYHDIARYCHEMAVSAMFSLGSDRKHAAGRVRQLHDGTPKQFWIVNLGDGFVRTPSGPLIDIADVASVPMLALWRGMVAHPWEGPPPVDGRGFMSVLFEATANPHLDPASRTNFFSEKNYILVSREYCSLHSRFGFHFVSAEARLGRMKRENYIRFQLRGGGADIERRILRVRFVADLLWEFGFAPQIQNDAVSARLENIAPEEGKRLLAVAGYMTIHTRQLDMIMQDGPQVAARRRLMMEHCRRLFTGGPPNA